ncbi:uncharacterized protein J4E87_007747 [Alternaria ethzedia]|uniref:uncharacterized protein n=1 Tax=Alternaria ethzedia TaxID=181014 RepID=UPI0020C4FC17|nr:uncharacterized protein J4E87_007747 [Alternaria ethzedia]KAI4619159.1 hypothetical protein J4E87_007747 [Alternaria ethzedia]
MTPDMAKAVNTVSQVLYRSDIHEYKQGGVSDVAIFDRIWFIITRQSVQDKFISPIVRELNKLIIAAEDDLGKMQVDDILPSEDAATDFQQVQLQNDYHTSLLQALVVLRKTIIEEKDVWDKSQDSAVRKHDRGQDVIGEAKRSKR